MQSTHDKFGDRTRPRPAEKAGSRACLKEQTLSLWRLLLVVPMLMSTRVPASAAAVAREGGAQAASAVQTPTDSVVPRLIRFSGTVKDADGKPAANSVELTFSLYEFQEGGSPLWVETQTVQLDSQGRYSVVLGAASPAGLPLDVFTTGAGRWLGVQPALPGAGEQPRVLLVSAPYALKAGDAETLGGLPASAFVLAVPAPASSGESSADSAATATTAGAALPATSSNVTTTGGTANTIPMFSTATNIQNSILTQTGTTAVNVEGTLNLPALGTATSSKGFNSQAHDFVASVFNSTSKAAAAQTFQLQAEPANNDTATAAGTLNLLYGSGTAAPSETGLKISNKGLITFATGQTFPGTGSGTLTGVTAGTDLTGGGTSGNVTLNLDTTKVPQLNTQNTFSGAQTFNGPIFTSGPINANDAAGDSSCTLCGNSTSSTGGGFGVLGTSTSVSAGTGGVEGVSDATSGETFGLEGVSESPVGVGTFAYATQESSTALGLLGCCSVGVWGDSGVGGVFGTAGIVGTADDGKGADFGNNSPSGFPTVFMFNSNSNPKSPVLEAAGNIGSGNIGSCTIDNEGDLTCTGTVEGAVSVDTGQRQVAFYAVEAPQNWFEDFGSGRLASGAATVTVDPTYAQTVNMASDYHVFLTPEGDCRGLYISHKTAAGFEVHELNAGQSNVAFSYRIVALRRGYENVRLEDVTETMEKMKASMPKPRATPGRLKLPVPSARASMPNSRPAGAR
jgi:hypothetical protein